MAIFGQNLTFLVSLTIYIELDGPMRYQNDAIDEADNLQPKIVWLG